MEYYSRETINECKAQMCEWWKIDEAAQKKASIKSREKSGTIGGSEMPPGWDDMHERLIGFIYNDDAELVETRRDVENCIKKYARYALKDAIMILLVRRIKKTSWNQFSNWMSYIPDRKWGAWIIQCGFSSWILHAHISEWKTDNLINALHSVVM